jgi:transposase InsO family protein
LNAYAERFVGSIKSECLRHIVPIGERHLRAIVREYVEHYHHERNHQGLDNVIPLPLGQPGKGVTAGPRGSQFRRDRRGPGLRPSLSS